MNLYIIVLMFSFMGIHAPLRAMHQQAQESTQAERTMEEDLSAADEYPMISIDLEAETSIEPKSLTGATIKTDGYTKLIAGHSPGMHINLATIKEVTFYYFPGLKNINLYYNHCENVHHIEALDATHLPNLHDISLMGNKMKTFSLGDTPFPYLAYINLWNNRIESIKFLQFAPNIKNFSLSGNNLQFLDFGSAVKFLHLEKLDLSYNHIISLEPLGWLACPSLQHLNLTGNCLVSLKGIDKANIKALSFLQIRKMNIHDVDPIITGNFALTHCGVETYTHQLCKLPSESIPEILMSNADGFIPEQGMRGRSRDGLITFLREQVVSSSKFFRYMESK